MLGFHLQENICFVQRVVLGILSTQSSDSCSHLIHCCDAPKQIKISNIMIQDYFPLSLLILCFFYNYFKRHYMIA